MPVTRFWDLYCEDLKKIENQIKEDLRSDVFLVEDVGSYILDSGGKRFRPLLLILSSRLCGYYGEEVYSLATVVELIHTATLLHDDVVDNADVRRGRTAAHRLWGNKASILVGDYLYTKALNHAVNLKNQEVDETLSEAVMLMCAGEVAQLMQAKGSFISEKEYLEIIKNKTAALISATCRLGGILGNVSGEKKDTLSNFGRNIGIAFQLADDILDYAADREKFGKSLGNDLKNGKITLPILHLLERCKPGEKDRVEAIIEAEHVEDSDLEFIQGLLSHYRSIEYSLLRASDYAESAKKELSCFADLPPHRALLEIAEHVVKRER